MNNVSHHPHAAQRYQSNGILGMLKLNLKPTGGKMAFLMEEGGHQVWGWKSAGLRYFSMALLVLSIWGGDLDGTMLAWTGNLVQPLALVKWLGLSVTLCPSLFIWTNMDFLYQMDAFFKLQQTPLSCRSLLRAGNHIAIVWQMRWHPQIHSRT